MNLLFIIFTFLHSLKYVLSETPDNNTIANYDPNELLLNIFNFNDTVPRADYALIKFQDSSLSYDELDDFNNQGFGDDNINVSQKGTIKYKDVSNVNSETAPDKNNLQDIVNRDNGLKKRRKKRKSKKQFYGLENQAVRPVFNVFQNPAFGGQYYRPPSPRPSVASEALSAVTDALTSIALYDDHQCVARLLCEAAGGGALGSSGILQTVTGLQPLLTLLAAYNGISTNPLFVFGRAVFLGMSAKGNTASCRYAYPLCPTDPEQLVHYLNSHNGGFFRFFKSPQQGQQNVEQLYNELSNNYGLYNQGQHYGFHNTDQAQNYGLQKPNYLDYGQNSYGLAFPYNHNKIRFKNSDFNKDINKIQRRIQNKPILNNVNDEEIKSKWTFPDTIGNNHINYVNNDIFREYDYDEDNTNTNREAKILKFPENNDKVNEPTGHNRKPNGFSFPEGQSNRHYRDYNYLASNVYNKVLYDNQYYVNNLHNVNNDDLDGVRTVYVVRGNGDPNKPEIIKLRPGETLQ